ncbi:MAG: dTDP-4-dehydrorhamnose 3,5-epimerase [Proteobacteria bacterium]|nr:dTDP-4-dehydrorhamnose 3,5-epimerase [Pseudomonadota bacterium]
MKVTSSPALPEVIIIEPDVYRDERGHFLETYQAGRYFQYEIPSSFVQDNLSFSGRGVLRGLHYQIGKPQAKLVWVVQGEAFDVAVDIRRGSPTFGKWVGITLSSEKYRQVYIPEGFAHGFCVTGEYVILAYKCTDCYAPKEERGIRWDDPSLAIEWPVATPILSDKDGAYPTLKEIPPEELPAFNARQSG